MKKILLIVAVFSSLSAFSQKDSTIVPTDSTALVTLKDYQQFDRDIIGEIPTKYSDIIRQWWNAAFNQRAKEWAAKNNKKAQPKNK